MGITKIRTGSSFTNLVKSTSFLVGNDAFSPLGNRGLFGGGNPSNVIDYITISTTGNATDFGDLTVSRGATYGTSSSLTRAVFMGGATADPYSNVMDYVTVSSTGNATDFGDLSEAIAHGTGTGNATRGIFAAGYGAVPINKIEYITIATTGNTTSFGTTSATRFGLTGVSSSTRSVFSSGYVVNVIDYVTIATTGNATDFGDMSTDGRNYVAPACSSTRGLFAGGYDGSAARNVIDYITIATTGNATDFGDLASSNQQFAGCSNSVRGVFQRENNMEYVTIATTGNTTSFGSMSAGSRISPMGTSNGHGGL